MSISFDSGVGNPSSTPDTSWSPIDHAYAALGYAEGALGYQKLGQYDTALDWIEKALVAYHQCDSELLDDFDDLEPLLHFHKGIILLYQGKTDQALDVLRNEYDPCHDLGQSLWIKFDKI